MTPGADGPSGAAALSSTGRYVAFASEAANLVPGDTNGTSDVFVRDRETGVATRVSVATGGGQADGPSGAPSISADGRHVAFESGAANLVVGDRNRRQDVFVRDRRRGHDGARQRLLARARIGPERLRAGDLRPRPPRRLHLARPRPRAGGRRPGDRRLRPRPAPPPHAAGEPRLGGVSH